MKRIGIAVILLAALLVGAMTHSIYLSTFTEGLTTLLTQAGEEADREDWDSARRDTALARRLWKERSVYLYITLHHGALDEIRSSFSDVETNLDHEFMAEYAEANARLVTQLVLLSEAERLSVENIL